MEWSQGSIADAIESARKDSKLLIVYIYAEDNDASEQVTSSLSDPILAPLSPRVVSMRLKNPSLEVSQFSAIYPVLYVPSIYVLCARTGVALKVYVKPQPADELFDEISELLNSRSKECISAEPSKQLVPQEGQAQLPNGVISQPLETPLPASTSSPSTPLNSRPDETPANEDSQSGSTIGDKVDRAERLIELRRLEKAEEERTEEKRKELERRAAMKNLQRIRDDHDQRETRQLLQEREDDKRYKERLQELVRQDRQERQQLHEAERAKAEERRRKELQEQQAKSDLPSSCSASSVNILFKLPDGTSVNHEFPAKSLFSEVRRYIENAKSLVPGSFQLALSFPRRVFETESDAQTLSDLQLSPSAVLLVLCKSPSGESSWVGGEGGFSLWSARGILDLLRIPISIIMGFVNSFFAAFYSPPKPLPGASSSGTSGVSGSVDSGTHRGPRNQSNVGSSASGGVAGYRDSPGVSRKYPSSANALPRKSYEKSGNIHRLNTDNDDSDENSTWNGNSTQQM